MAPEPARPVRRRPEPTIHPGRPAAHYRRRRTELLPRRGADRVNSWTPSTSDPPAHDTLGGAHEEGGATADGARCRLPHPGHLAQSRDRDAFAALFDYFARSQHLTDNTLKLHPQTVTVSGDLVGVLMRVMAERPDGRVMDTLLAQTRRLADDGRWCEYWAAADDQDTLDAFWA